MRRWRSVLITVVVVGGLCMGQHLGKFGTPTTGYLTQKTNSETGIYDHGAA